MDVGGKVLEKGLEPHGGAEAGSVPCAGGDGVPCSSSDEGSGGMGLEAAVLPNLGGGDQSSKGLPPREMRGAEAVGRVVEGRLLGTCECEEEPRGTRDWEGLRYEWQTAGGDWRGGCFAGAEAERPRSGIAGKHLPPAGKESRDGARRRWRATDGW